MNRLAPMVVVVLFAAGCGQVEPMGQVRGRVTYKGKPVPGGIVLFVPTSGVAAGGGIDAEGNYRLLSRKPGDGALTGTHKVAIVPPTPDQMPAGYPRFPEHYRDPETSGLTAEVGKGNNICDFELIGEPTGPAPFTPKLP